MASICGFQANSAGDASFFYQFPPNLEEVIMPKSGFVVARISWWMFFSVLVFLTMPAVNAGPVAAITVSVSSTLTTNLVDGALMYFGL
jgi:hypothetical protein